MCTDTPAGNIQVELSTEVLRRLLIERQIVASDVRFLNNHSCRAGRSVLLSVLSASRVCAPDDNIRLAARGPHTGPQALPRPLKQRDQGYT